MNGAVAAEGPVTAARPRTAVIAAMREELAPLMRRVLVERKWGAGRCRAVLGRLAGTPVVLAHTGDGAKNASAGARALLSSVPVSRVLVVGVAGGLSPDLEPGALLVSRTILEQNGTGPPPDADWLQSALRQGQARAGSILTAPKILGTVGDKAAAWRTVPDDDPAVVDLESAAFARVADELGLPFLIVRAVSDSADESLPLDLNAFRDDDGAVRRGAIARHVMAHPHLVRPLWHLRRRVATGSQSLARFVCVLLEGDAR